MVKTNSYQAFADLLRYPSDPGAQRLRGRIAEITEDMPELGESLAPMLAYASEHDTTELEEAFTRTFDSNAERALELGWHLHGENYARGVFMVRMRQLLREHAVDETSELPDHVSHVLGVLGRAEPVLARALSASVVKPALEKIVEGFTNKANPYLSVIVSLQQYLKREVEANSEAAAHE